MEKLQRIYLCTHALAWSKHGDGLLEMDDIERHEKLDMAEDWPGRIVVDVEFPAETVVECDVMGYPLCRARGLVEYPYRYFHGPMTMRAGTGAHTSLYSTIAMAVPEFSLEDFRAALLAGKVCELEE